MDWDMAVIEDDDDIVFKVKRSAIAEALRSNALVPIPATDANIDVAVNQLFSKIKEVSLPVIDDYYFDLGMDYFYNGRSLYKRIYELFECNVNFDGFCLCLGFSWVSKDESILYLAITNATNGLTVLHLSFAALNQVVKHEEDNVFWIDGAVRDFHVDDAYAESDRVLEFAQISPAAADFFSEHPVCSKNGVIDLSDVMNWTNFKADGRELAALRELSDEELAAEIEKAGRLDDGPCRCPHEPCPRTRRDREGQHRILRCSKTARGPPVRIRTQAARVAQSREKGKRTQSAGHGPLRPPRPRWSAAAAPSSTAATSTSNHATGNTSRPPYPLGVST